MHAMKTKLKCILTNIFTSILLLFACFFMYDFYKCLSGFIANGFREPTVMLPMVLPYLLPVICFFFYFYDFYVKSVHRVGKIIYSALVIIYSIVCLIFIFMNIKLYASNNALGGYDALPSIIVHFPYDMIIILISLILLQGFNLFTVFKPNATPSVFKSELASYGFFKLHIAEYLPLCVLGIVVFVFTGASITATFTALSNAFYDFRYIFLLLWVFICPMMNLLCFIFKPENLPISRLKRALILGGGIATNLLFGALLLVFELTYPDFIVHIGKPLFLIAFSVSLPIEMGVILGIQALGTVAMIIKFIFTLTKNTYRKV